MDDNGAMRRNSGTRLIWRVVPYAATFVIFVLLGRRVPLRPLLVALKQADYLPFLALMAINTAFYFVWDTLLLWKVMSWFHQPVPYRELLPARAASYISAMFNANLARGTLAYYLTRRTDGRFLQLGSTVMFLTVTEFTHLIGWATAGVLVSKGEAPWRLLLVAPIVAVTWLVFLLYVKFGITLAVLRGRRPPRFSLLRTFQVATPRRYIEVIVLRIPMFLVSLVTHYFAARTFGIALPFSAVLTFLPVIFMVGALPVTVAHLGTTQAAWMLFFGRYAIGSRLVAFSLAAHLSFMVMRVCLSLLFAIPAFGVLFPERAVPPGPEPRETLPTDWALH
jgi:hypothetical protein